MCVTVAKVGQGQPTSKDCRGCLTSAILPNVNVLAQVIGVHGTGKPKVGQGVLTFLRRSRSRIRVCKTIPSCMAVHDNVAVAVSLRDMFLS